MSVDEAVRLALATAGSAAPASGPIGEGDPGDLVAQACITLADWLAACPEQAAAAWSAAHKVGHVAVVKRALIAAPSYRTSSPSAARTEPGKGKTVRAVFCLELSTHVVTTRLIELSVTRFAGQAMVTLKYLLASPGW